jgi:O-antigen/teichoic acid export membrane protein
VSERRRNTLQGIIFGYASLAIALARNVLLVPTYLRHIPLAAYGAWVATGGALALILINDYGFSGVVMQRISASHGARQFTAAGRLAGSALAISGILAVVLSAISLALAPFLPAISQLAPAQHDEIIACFMLAVASNGLGVVGQSAISIIRSLQRAELAGAITLCAEIANVTVIVAGLHLGYGLYSLAGGLVMRAVVLTLGGLGAVWPVTRGLGARIEVHVAEVRDLTAESLRFFLSSIAIKLISQANVLFVGMILGPAAAAVYSLTVRAYETVVLLIGQITGYLVAPITHLFGSGNRARFSAVIARVFVLLSALTSYALTLTVILNPAFLSLWVGARAFGGQAVSVLMGAAMLVCLVGGVAYDALLAQGRFSVITRYYAIASVLQVAALLLLLRHGMWGAPLATLLTSGIWVRGFSARVAETLGLEPGEWRRHAFAFARIVLISAALAWLFALLYPMPQSWGALLVEGIFAATCLAAAYLSISASLRKVVYEELGITTRLFRPT